MARALRRPRPSGFSSSDSRRLGMRGLAAGAILAGLAAVPLHAQSLDARLPTCFACHGENGTSQLPETPSLGAQTAFYSTVQLLMFRDKLRVTEPMNEMAKGLS